MQAFHLWVKCIWTGTEVKRRPSNISVIIFHLFKHTVRFVQHNQTIINSYINKKKLENTRDRNVSENKI